MEIERKEAARPARNELTEMQLGAIGRVAKMIVSRCVRYTSIEQIHAGKEVRSQTGDYSDVKVVTPFGEIPWNEVERITQDEMKRFTKEVVNKMYTVLINFESEREMRIGRHAFHSPADWDAPELDPNIDKLFD